MLEELRGKGDVAYFVTETAIDKTLPFQTGGLGVLAGGIFREAYEQGYPMLGVSVWPKCRTEQYIDRERERMGFRYPEINTDGIIKYAGRISIAISGVRNFVDIGLLPEGQLGTCPVLFLKTWGIPENGPLGQSNTLYLYGGTRETGCNEKMEIAHGIVLGRGTVKTLRTIGIDPLYHINESWGVFVQLALLEEERKLGKSEEDAIESVRERTVFTNHTPIAAGNKKFPMGLVEELWGHESPVTRELLTTLSGDLFTFNSTVTAIKLARRGGVSAVAKGHGQTMLDQWSEVLNPDELVSITNGKNLAYWQHPRYQYVQNWAELEEAKLAGKREFLRWIHDTTGLSWSENILTIGEGGRWTGYKRKEILFRDEEWISSRLRQNQIQIVAAGKPHPDEHAQIEAWNRVLRMSQNRRRFPNLAVIPDYDLEKMRAMQQSVDLWMNTPIPPYEACGSAGMGVSMNGGLNISIIDGWMCEVDEKNHFLIRSTDNDSEDLKLIQDMMDETIIPMYYHTKEEWYRMGFAAMQEILSMFTTARVLREYDEKMYRPQR